MAEGGLSLSEPSAKDNHVSPQSCGHMGGHTVAQGNSVEEGSSGGSGGCIASLALWPKPVPEAPGNTVALINQIEEEGAETEQLFVRVVQSGGSSPEQACEHGCFIFPTKSQRNKLKMLRKFHNVHKLSIF